MMQSQSLPSYQGYYDATGSFRTIGGNPIPRQGHAVLLFLDNPPQHSEDNDQLAAFDEFMAAIHGCGENVPEFERAQLHREVEI